MITHNHIKSEHPLNIGEIGVFNKPMVITCFGLGSCVGLFLYDRIHKVGGGAHIMLPEYNDDKSQVPKHYYADHAIAALMVQMKIKRRTTKGSGLRAKLVGGASLFVGDHLQVGKKNVAIVMELLLQMRIYIAGMDVGGSESRTARFDTENGKVEVSTPSHKHIF